MLSGWDGVKFICGVLSGWVEDDVEEGSGCCLRKSGKTLGEGHSAWPGGFDSRRAGDLPKNLSHKLRSFFAHPKLMLGPQFYLYYSYTSNVLAPWLFPIST